MPSSKVKAEDSESVSTTGLLSNEDFITQVSSASVPSSPSSSRSRRRKAANLKRMSNLATSSPATTRQVQTLQTVHSVEDEISPQWSKALTHFLFESLVFVADVVTHALKLLKYPLTIILSLYLLSFLVSRLYLAMTTPMTSALAAICELPGSSLLGLEFCRVRSVGSTKSSSYVDYPKLMEIEMHSFEKLLDNSIASSDLIFDLKKAEMASTDLSTILMASDLPMKEHLSAAIRGFVEDARRSQRALQRLDAKIEGTIDQVTAFNEYTMQSLSSASHRSALLPLQMLRSALMIREHKDHHITELFDQVMSMVEIHMERLLAEAHAALSLLDRLEERLTAIHLLVAQEDVKVSAARQDLLAELWSLLGGNKRQLAKYNRHINILRSIDTARQRALAHVVVAVTTVESAQANLEDLRERASSPGLVGNGIPLEAHVLSMKAGLERIASSRARIGQEKAESLNKLLVS